MTAGITSLMSPGYLQVNPYFNESAFKLSKRYKDLYKDVYKKPENYPNKSSKDVDFEDSNATSHKPAAKGTVNGIEETEKNRSERANGFQFADKSESMQKKEEDYREKAIIAELERKEREVLSHEAAHIAVGGRFAGNPKYTRVMGPDGKSYITGGEVPISVPPSSDPKETIRDMEQVKAAALAPTNPSSQDINVAAAAASIKAQATAEHAAEANAQIQAAAELATHQAEWGKEPQPARYVYEATNRIPAGLPMAKKYRSAVVHNEEQSDAASSANLTSKDKTKSYSNNITEYESFSHRPAALENNLYYTRQARKIYFMTSSPRGLWTVDKGFERTPSSPAFRQAQILNLAA